jgi:hypothetical protein
MLAIDSGVYSVAEPAAPGATDLAEDGGGKDLYGASGPRRRPPGCDDGRGLLICSCWARERFVKFA